jgi:putative membrane protein
MVRKFLIRVLVSAAAVWAADYLLVGFTVFGGLQGYLLAGLVLGALNTFVRPIIKLLTLPLIMVTLGFFTFVINAGMLWFVSRALDSVDIVSIWSLAWATIIVSFVNMVFVPVTKH